MTVSIDPKRPELHKCKCDLRTRLVGDGCQYCNPEYAKQFEDLTHPRVNEMEG